MPSALTTDLSMYLNREDAGVRGRAWAWQSAMGLQVVEGSPISAYLAETARRHIEGVLPLELVCRLVDAYYLTQAGSATEAADRKVLELVRLLSAPQGVTQGPPAVASPSAAPAAAPESAAELHPRQKRLLRTLGSETLGVPELLQALRLSSRQSFARVWLSPAMEMGLVKALHPHAPRHPQQKYLLTRKGQRFLKQLIRK